MRGRIAVIALALVAVVIAFAASRDDEAKTGGDTKARPAAPPPGAVRLGFLYSPEKQELLKPLIARFNREQHTANGRPVHVDARSVSSGEAEAKIADQRLQPVLWSPASSLWGRLLNFSADKPYVDSANPSLVRTPLVIAMWEPLARALGWPRQRVGFRQILRLARSREGWAAYGRPQYGAFKLGHTNPDFSTSGLSAVAAEYYAVSGKLEGLTAADVDRPTVRRQIRDIERSIIHYGDTTLFFAEQLARYGPAYASAVAMEEVTLLDFNRDRTGTKLVALYPAEGTFFSDNPLVVLRAPWVSREEAAAAETVSRWLRERVTPELAARYGFRPGDPKARPLPPIIRENGADPAAPRRVISLPQPAVLSRIKQAWREDRKSANIMVVLDTSGSMGEEGRLIQAKRGLRAFFRQLSPKDRVGLMQFNSEVTLLEPIGPFGRRKGRLLNAVEQLLPEGRPPSTTPRVRPSPPYVHVAMPSASTPSSC